MSNPISKTDLLIRLRQDHLEHVKEGSDKDSIIFGFIKEESDARSGRYLRSLKSSTDIKARLKRAKTVQELIDSPNANQYVLISVLEALYKEGLITEDKAAGLLGGILTVKNETEFAKIAKASALLGISSKIKDNDKALKGKERKAFITKLLTGGDDTLEQFKTSLIKKLINNFFNSGDIRKKAGNNARDTSYRDDIRLYNYYLRKTDKIAADKVLTDSLFENEWEDFYLELNRPGKGRSYDTFLIYQSPVSPVSLWIMGRDLLGEENLRKAHPDIPGKNYYYTLRYDFSMDSVSWDGVDLTCGATQILEVFTDIRSALARLEASGTLDNVIDIMTDLGGHNLEGCGIPSIRRYEQIRQRLQGKITPSPEDKRTAEQYGRSERTDLNKNKDQD